MRKLIIFTFLFSFCLQLPAQDSETYKAKYHRLAKLGGPAGVGIETVIEDWEKVAPNDRNLLAAKFNFYLAKSKSETVIPLSKDRYLGQKPLFELKDSLGNKVKYFSDISFNDSLYFKSLDAVDCAIALYPDDLDLRISRIGSLILHNKEKQDETKSEVLALLDYHSKNHPQWMENDKEAESAAFEGNIQNCCFELYNVGSESAYEAFKTISEKASKMFPKNTDFLNNLGVYWLIAKSNPNKAISYYKKVLKLNPDEESAKKNLKLAQKTIDNKKKKK